MCEYTYSICNTSYYRVTLISTVVTCSMTVLNYNTMHTCNYVVFNTNCYCVHLLTTVVAWTNVATNCIINVYKYVIELSLILIAIELLC